MKRLLGLRSRWTIGVGHPAQQLHHDEHVPARSVDPCVDDLNDVLAHDAGGHARFGQQPIDGNELVVASQYFERHAPLGGQLLGYVHGAKAAARERRDDSIAVADDRAVWKTLQNPTLIWKSALSRVISPWYDHALVGLPDGPVKSHRAATPTPTSPTPTQTVEANA